MASENAILLIIQIVTLIISLITLTSELVVSVLINKKTLTSKIVAQQRLVFMEQIREATKVLMCLCDADVIDAYRAEQGEKEPQSQYIYRLLAEKSRMKLLLKDFFAQENEINIAMERMTALAIGHYKQAAGIDAEVLRSELRQAGTAFFDLINVYDLAYWDFIIAQASGSNTKSESFDHIYQKVKEDVSGQPQSSENAVHTGG